MSYLKSFLNKYLSNLKSASKIENRKRKKGVIILVVVFYGQCYNTIVVECGEYLIWVEWSVIKFRKKLQDVKFDEWPFREIFLY